MATAVQNPAKVRSGWAPALSAAAISGAALATLFPSLGWDWLAWIALVPLFVVVARATNFWRALWPGYLAGVIFFAISCPWIAPTIHNYGQLNTATAGLVFLLFLLLMGSYLGIFAILGYWAGRGSRHRLWPLPFAWVAVELLRTYTPMGGFPWNLLGYSQVNHAGFMQVAPIAGIFGASFLIALANTLVAALLLRFYDARGSAPRTLPVTLEAVGLGLILAYATWPYHPPPVQPYQIQARLVQPNTPLDASWTTVSLQQFLAAQQQLSLSQPAPSRPPSPASSPVSTLSDPGPSLIVWPEQPAPLDYDLQPALQSMTAALLAQTHAAFLFEEISYPLKLNGAPNYNRPRNSAQFIAANGTTGPRYDKMHLVPFGEYVPLPRWIKHVAGINKLVQDVGDFVPGKKPVLFSLDGHRFATMICYESIFPALARQDVAAGAEWLVNQSDDSWYGHSSAAAQGLMMARLRAMENRRWLLRDTNNGITAVIDPYGRVVARLPRFRAAALQAGLVPRTRLTFYTRHGDWAAGLSVLILAGFLLVAALERKPPPASPAA